MQRLGPALEASQVAWSRAAKRWGELTNPASRTDPALVGAASELRSAIAAAASNQGGWATPDQLATRVNLPAAVRSLHLSMGHRSTSPTSSATLRPTTPALPDPHASSA